MHFKLVSLLITVSVALGALAGQNCKCQASNGQGPQDDAATQYCCTGAGASLFGTTRTCSKPAGTYPGGSHQCDAKGTNCINSGAFVSCCKLRGAPGAFCWN
ncbi:hypothetical protein BKA70DRAFT_1237016 [Coprinopsis sp. MPI-PUGE-AT-0042]|nr:hypothetical protein BKA70DRAFT_1237016 [Coprinopsis sp. MPI-PUGE-AT-0042]